MQQQRPREWRPENGFSDLFCFTGPMPAGRYFLTTAGATLLCWIVPYLVWSSDLPRSDLWMPWIWPLTALPALWVLLAAQARRWREIGHSPSYLALDLLPGIFVITWLYKLIRRGDSDLP